MDIAGVGSQGLSAGALRNDLHSAFRRDGKWGAGIHKQVVDVVGELCLDIRGDRRGDYQREAHRFEEAEGNSAVVAGPCVAGATSGPSV